MDEGIFRNIAQENSETKWVPNTIIRIYPPSVILYVITSFLMIFLLILIFVLKISNRVEIEGEVNSFPSTVIVRSPITGYIELSNFSILESPTLHKGDIILKVKNVDEDINGDLKIQKLKKLHSIIDKLNKNINDKKELKVKVDGFYKKNITFTEQEIKRLRNELNESNKIIQEHNNTRKKYELFLKRGYVTIEQLNSISNNYAQNKISYINIHQQLNSLLEKKSQFFIDRDSKINDIDNKISSLQEQINEIELKKIDINSDTNRIITSPIDGVLDYQYKTLGQEVVKNDPLLKISPKKVESYFLIFSIKSEHYPYVKIGEKINVRFKSYPFQKYGSFDGVIDKISQSIVNNENITSQRLKIDTKNISDNFYSIQVKITDKNIDKLKLVAGMKAETSLLIENKTIYNFMVDKAKYNFKKYME
ncbi:HlyD family secretion protein [Xenorhabdus griffiniae]|uniref:HlyD family efflux transporter periplasmic adaptor subunit n=1 Tax=Xenorhabdus griffiniae TaxID=351672 RepID=A0ABY9XFE3_9GAMM|nr:HlyD family efflux transporter periplasmic adaptor subunit [Xenorhabdus griffiniae]MBD1229404.1 HlyD family efflux transporter periplasmic adaptor subunit [Xenorhabdus griffiniae]WMV71599.1 HlyD family efflux transporter periplasmic adaptor subunit [Xenorhabdus griffiniae]WNH01276.1 HlyD family efflux transporter periplasmic adaptor subunit [Xenorhabdus griffiniae]